MLYRNFRNAVASLKRARIVWLVLPLALAGVGLMLTLWPAWAAGPSVVSKTKTEAIEAIEPLRLAWASAESDSTAEVAWGDYDGDGDLDLAAGGFPDTRLYRNDKGELMPEAVWTDPDFDNSTSLAWGDVDNDGDLDLAIGNKGDPNLVYPNNGGTLGNASMWSSTESDDTQSVAWGDVNGDGRLDLVVGNLGQPNRLYLNTGSTLATTASWSASAAYDTNDVTLVDFDQDGDLDLAVGNDSGQANLIYRNTGGTLTSTPVFTTPETEDTNALAWGDYDGDGALDLAVANYSAPNRLYHNDTPPGSGTTPAFTLVFSVPNVDENFTSVDWGDYDADGDLDLALSGVSVPTQVYNNNNGLFSTTPTWQSSEVGVTKSIQWGDYDNDGLLDLATGNNGHPNWLFHNEGAVLSANPVWELYNDLGVSAAVYAAAWGDVDRDGDLDLALGAQGTPTALYILRNNTLTTTPALAIALSIPSNGVIRNLAWGDYNADGKPDLAAGSYTSTIIYRNDTSAGPVILTAVFTKTFADPNISIQHLNLAWGDYDSDGDLDLVTGNEGSLNLYPNLAGSISTTPVWTIPNYYAASLAWGDIEGDGDLDLAAGVGASAATQIEVFHNDSGNLPGAPTWSAGDVSWTSITGVAWGDYDGDGDPDLAVAQDSGPRRIYRNDSGVLTLNAVWVSLDAGPAADVAWGDYDGDGDLDLASNDYTLNRVYLNDDQELTEQAVWTYANGGEYAYGSVWGDYDQDGDPDLLAGNTFGTGAKIFRNLRDVRTGARALEVHITQPGAASFYATSQIRSGIIPISYTLTPSTTPVSYLRAYYSPDGGGLWYPATPASGAGTTTSSYTNTTPLAIVDNSVVTSTLPVPATGNLLDVDARLNLTHTYDADLIITLIAPSGDRVILSQYQGGSGDNFTNTIFDDEAATPISAGTPPFTGRFRPEEELTLLDGQSPAGTWQLEIQDTALQDEGTLLSWGLTLTLSSGVQAVFNWDVGASGFFGQSDNMVFRLEAVPAITQTANTGPGPYRYGWAATQSLPFRVRGTQVRVISNTVPMANAIVYRLPAGQSTGADAMGDSAGNLFSTNAQGYLQGRGQLNLNDKIAALLPISSTSAYTLYYMSASPSLTGLNFATVSAGGVQTLTVSSANPLVLFNPKISLEWDARQDAAYLQQLDFNLARASESLFDWSNGQAALGTVTVYQNKEHWSDANVRLYASNGYRPNADIGGSVTALYTEVVTISPTLTNTLSYAPGQIRMPSAWSRFGDNGSSGSTDWSRALAHEYSHYYFFLDDAYLGLNSSNALIAVTSCTGTAMADPYRDDYSEFKHASDWSPGCDETLAARTSGRPEWTTITQPSFFPWLTATNNNGPLGLPINTLHTITLAPSAPDTTLDAPVYNIVQNGALVEPGESARTILFQQNGLMDLGQARLGQITARGARPGDRLCLFEPVAARLGCEIVTVGDTELTISTTVSSWNPDVNLTPVTSQTINVLVSNLATGLTLQARIYPDNGAPTDPYTLTEGPVGSYSTIVTLTSPVFAASLDLWVNEAAAPRRELISDYTLGGNPASPPKPRKKGGAPVISADGQLMIYGEPDFPLGEFYAIQSVTNLPTPPAWVTVIGQGYRLLKSAGAPSFAGTALNFNYLGSQVPPGEEAFISVYFYSGTTWIELPTTLEPGHNVAIAPAQGPGLYALMSSYNIPLYGPGWNLFAYPVQATRTVTESLASISGTYGIVYSYLITDTLNPWRVFAVGAPGYANDLVNLEFGRGYWISMTVSNILRLKGTGLGSAAPEAVLPIAPTTVEGENVFAPAPPTTFYGLVLGDGTFTPAPGMVVTAFINGNVCGQGQTLNSGGAIVYVVHVYADDGGQYAGCGVFGRTINFRVNGVDMFATPPWNSNQVWDVTLSPSALTSLYLPLIRR